jgi:hypothetical protein
MSPRTSILAVLLAASTVVTAQVALTPPQAKRMSIHNRLLLNRLAVTGHHTLEVMLALEASGFDRVSAQIERLGGRVRRSEPSIAYVRAEIPIEKLVELVADPAVDAYQISSLSRGSWYRDGPPQDNAEMFRGFEIEPVVHAAPIKSPAKLPLLAPSAARESGYTADDDAGVGEWMRSHPTFDGRGVTIAFVETAQVEFGHPTLRSASALDGTEIPKLVSILNTIDPDDRDDTRVDLNTEVRAVSTWCRIGNRTYIVPHPGTYRFGLFALPAGNNLVQQFGVIRDEASGEIRVDTNGDADFRDEAPVVEVNKRYDVHTLRLSYPREAELAFVLAEGPIPHQLHIYVAGNGHQAMTVSVSAGSRTDDGLASGVAPAARVLLVRSQSLDVRLSGILEGYLDAIKRADVDILCDSIGITMVPDTARDFAGLFMSRLTATYRKPIFHGAGNSLLLLNGVSPLGDAFSVGGSISAATFSALYGGGPIDSMMVHPTSTSGPALDGALKPDFLAPMHRIAAGAALSSDSIQIPKNAPTMRLPSGYTISCCTSASSPYAAGVAALLLSAAKQQGLPYSVETLGRALRLGARFLQDWPAHQQGNGVLDVNAAWRELQQSFDIPRIRVTGANVHALAAYAVAGASGVGLFEREGWQAGSRGRRVLQLTRESGIPKPVTYRLDWTGNDGTFSSASFVTLPLNEAVSLPLDISAASQGAHSAILNLHDPASDAIVLRSEATIVASARLDAPDRTAHFTGSVPMMRSVAHYVTLPEGVAALSIELEVLRGVMHTAVLPSPGVIREYYAHVLPQFGRMLTRGKYRLLLPWPSAGTWSITLINDSAWRESDKALVSTDEAAYTISVQALTTSLSLRATPAGNVSVDITNRAAVLQEPVLEVSTGTLTSHRASFLPSGLPNQFDIDVPIGSSTLALLLRGEKADTGPLELHLYDCTTGECFSYDFSVPAAKEQRLEVRKPKPGRWVAAINAAPFPTTSGGFVLDEIITHGVQRQAASRTGSRRAGDHWTETLDITASQSDGSNAIPVLLCELVDAAAERDATAHPWETRKVLTNFAERSVATGMALLRLR